MIEIKHLKTLQALRNSGSLAGAAAALHQTQSALSHQFSDLEQRLGFRLFVRKVSRCALRRRERSCCSWPIRSCRKSAAPCRIAMSRSKPGCVSPSNAIAVFSGSRRRWRVSAPAGRMWRWTFSPG